MVFLGPNSINSVYGPSGQEPKSVEAEDILVVDCSGLRGCRGLGFRCLGFRGLGFEGLGV